MAAQDLEKLVVQLSADIKKYEGALSRAQAVTNQRMGAIQKRATASSNAIAAAFGGIGTKVAGALAAAAGGRAATSLMDSAKQIENSLKVAGLAGEDLKKVYDKLFASAQKNAVPLEAMAVLYGRISQAQDALNVSQEEMTNFTDKVGVALRVAGASSQEAAGALLQLSQALGAGIVRAEEYNSINEGARPILQAVAAGLREAGGDVAKLRNLVMDGKVSSEAFFRAFEAGAVTLEEKVAGAETTVSQQLVRLQNVLTDAAGKMDDATGASERLGDILSTLGDGVEDFGNVAADVADSDLAKLLGYLDRLVAAAGTFKKLMGGIPGIIDKFGKLNYDALHGKPLGSSIAEQAIQDRIDAAFEGTGVDPKGGRLPAKPAPRVIDRISLDDYAVPDDGKGGKKGRGGSRRSADELQREIEQIKERTAAIQTEIDAQAALNGRFFNL